MNKDEQTKTGMGLFGTLQIIFIVLKLAGLVDWPWFWILSPIIFEMGFVIFILLIACILTIVDNER